MARRRAPPSITMLGLVGPLCRLRPGPAPLAESLTVWHEASHRNSVLLQLVVRTRRGPRVVSWRDHRAVSNTHKRARVGTQRAHLEGTSHTNLASLSKFTCNRNNLVLPLCNQRSLW